MKEFRRNGRSFDEVILTVRPAPLTAWQRLTAFWSGASSNWAPWLASTSWTKSAVWFRDLWQRCAAPRAKTIRLVDSLALGERRSVLVLVLEGRKFLIGATPHSLALLAELQPDPVSASSAGAPCQNLAEELRASDSRKTISPAESTEASTGESSGDAA